MGNIAPPLEKDFFKLGNKSGGSQVDPPVVSKYDTASVPEVERVVSGMSKDIQDSMRLGLTSSESRQKQVTDAISTDDQWEQPKDVQEGYFEFLRLRWGHDDPNNHIGDPLYKTLKWDPLSHFTEDDPKDRTDTEIRRLRSHVLNPHKTPEKSTYVRVVQTKNDSYRNTFTDRDPVSNEAPMLRNRGRCKCYNSRKVAPDGWMEWQRSLDFLYAGKKFIFLDMFTQTYPFPDSPYPYTEYDTDLHTYRIRLVRWDKFGGYNTQLIADNPCNFEYRCLKKNYNILTNNMSTYIECIYQPSSLVQAFVDAHDSRLTASPLWLFCEDEMLTRAFFYMYKTL